MSQSRMAEMLLATVVGTLAGCGGQDPRRDGPAAGQEAGAAAELRPAVSTVPLPRSPCEWIPVSEVAALVGPLEGTPERVRNAEQSRPDADGTACLYRLAARPGMGKNELLVEVSPTAGVMFERTMGAMQQHFATVLADGKPPAEQEKSDKADEGWDYSGGLPMGLGSYIGRVGHLSVLVVSQSPDVPRPRLAALAAAVRDRVPDLPFPLPPDPMLEELKRQEGGAPDPPASGPDPCSLLTRAEVEAVLGPLVVEPYRSSENTPLADPYGSGCAYLAKGHRALVLKPHWNGGEMMFGMARQVGGQVALALPEAGPDRESADTLDGPWDEAAANGTTGELYFLKGDRMLELGYLTSSIGTESAVRLATMAVERL